MVLIEEIHTFCCKCCRPTLQNLNQQRMAGWLARRPLACNLYKAPLSNCFLNLNIEKLTRPAWKMSSLSVVVRERDDLDDRTGQQDYRAGPLTSTWHPETARSEEAVIKRWIRITGRVAMGKSYLIIVMEVPKFDNVSMNYSNAILYRMFWEICSGKNGLPVSWEIEVSDGR